MSPRQSAFRSAAVSVSSQPVKARSIIMVAELARITRRLTFILGPSASQSTSDTLRFEFHWFQVPAGFSAACPGIPLSLEKALRPVAKLFKVIRELIRGVSKKSLYLR